MHPLPQTLKKGTYVFVLQLEHEKRICIGKLGMCSFEAGYYLYVGSAFGPGGLKSRLSRYLQANLKPHWHIDYLRKHGRVVEFWISEEQKASEHLWAGLIYSLKGVRMAVPRFGSSDCSCLTHLFVSSKKPRICSFKQLLQEASTLDHSIRALPVQSFAIHHFP